MRCDAMRQCNAVRRDEKKAILVSSIFRAEEVGLGCSCSSSAVGAWEEEEEAEEEAAKSPSLDQARVSQKRWVVVVVVSVAAPQAARGDSLSTHQPQRWIRSGSSSRSSPAFHRLSVPGLAPPLLLETLLLAALRPCGFWGGVEREGADLERRDWYSDGLSAGQGRAKEEESTHTRRGREGEEHSECIYIFSCAASLAATAAVLALCQSVLHKPPTRILKVVGWMTEGASPTLYGTREYGCA